jgi:hypothetical protein
VCLLSSLAAGGSLLADGNETIGAPGLPLARGNVIFAAGIGLGMNQPGTIVIDIPDNVDVEQVLLYWGLRTLADDSTALLNGSITVNGPLIGTSPTFGSVSRPYVHRADITDLDLIGPGRNEVRVAGLRVTGENAMADGASIVVIGNDGGSASIQVLDGCDFAYWDLGGALRSTMRQKLMFEPAGFERQGQLILLVGDHTPPDPGDNQRPSTLEVAIEGGQSRVFHDPLTGRDGPSWDTLSIPLTIPAGSTRVDAQLFSETRTGSQLSPSSFFWLFAALRISDGGLGISGTVYSDLDGDGDRDGGEPGIAGVEVSSTCMDDGEMVKDMATTGADGSYTIGGVPLGADCTVSVVRSAALEGKEPTEECPPIENIRESVTGCDFGFATPPVVGDTVFLDSNGDGAQQAGETGLAGVEVSIVSPAVPGFEGFDETRTTDANGKYLFTIPGVPAGAMLVSTVSIDPDSGAARGKTLTTPNPQQTIPLGPGGMDLARDFGLSTSAGDARVGDTVFSDLDADGEEDPGEPGIAGVDVMIECPAGDDFPAFSQTMTTDAGGKYLFVVPDIPEEARITCEVSIDLESEGAEGKVLTTPSPQETAPLGPGASDLARDFGLAAPEGAVVGDTVFCDLDGNGRQEGAEPGIAGVEVQLAVPAGGGFPGSNQVMTTDVNGKYLFTIPGIPFGSTVVARVSIDVTAQVLSGKVLTTPNPQDTRPLGPGGEDRDRDFGLEPLAAQVGDTVFLDLNASGIQEVGEPGLAGVAVRIEAPATGAFGGFSQNAVTGADGKYLFAIEGIPHDTPVVATVTIDPATGSAAGRELTTPNPQETDPLGPGDEDLDRDFGLRPVDIDIKICLEEKTVLEGECVDVRVLLSSTEPVEAFVTAVKHDPAALDLDAIGFAGTATEANMADFTSFEIFSDGGTAAAVLDLEAPFLGNLIPAGDSMPIAVYRYCARPLPGTSVERVTPLRFVDGELGTPPRENVIVIGGLSLLPELCHGSVTTIPSEEPVGPCFLCGGPELGPDKSPTPVRGAPGEQVEVCFYYCSPEDNLPGHEQFDHLQGLSMAIRFDCRLECLEGTFRVPPDTITDAIGVDFVSFQCENDPNDGDGCELIFSLLVDSEPPFDGRTLPPTEIPLKLACVDFRIREEAPCGACLANEFTDGVNGRGQVPIKNLFAAENKSFSPRTIDCAVCVSAAPLFLRGDCNGDMKPNLADAAATVSYLFPLDGSGGRTFLPPCLDACDVNDDGRLDVSDPISLLNWLFRSGLPPPEPGPDEIGRDTTDDKLDCALTECPAA